MMDYEFYLGIDVSKKTLDLCLLNSEGELAFGQGENNKDFIKKTLKPFLKENHAGDKDTLLICAENTGHYSNILSRQLLVEGFKFWPANPFDMHLSQGLKRGKSDRVDAERIAIYAKRYSDKARLLQPGKEVHQKLAYLSRERELLVTDRAKYRAQLTDEKNFFSTSLYKDKQKRYELIIKTLSNSINEIESKIDKLIDSDETLKEQFEICTSVTGIGKQTAIETIIKSEGFTKISDGKKFACHAGCAPFSHHSGTSIRSANRVSKRADKKLKTLFHMAALSAIKVPGEFQAYFVRKVAEGKNKMTVVNTIRNKLILRIFALIRDNRKYEKKYSPIL